MCFQLFDIQSFAYLESDVLLVVDNQGYGWSYGFFKIVLSNCFTVGCSFIVVLFWVRGNTGAGKTRLHVALLSARGDAEMQGKAHLALPFLCGFPVFCYRYHDVDNCLPITVPNHKWRFYHSGHPQQLPKQASIPTLPFTAHSEAVR
ncbi:hypothetical protein EZS27_025191 [termite gut metagenome]|uniref:Uncharacterized protein n=1 Tax=termite gut metagenome TaxID=433724 RepID=A0A5J4QVV1_9ZZZZ